MKHQVYILYSDSKGKFYIGYTGDTMEERISRHNTNHKGFTGRTGDWRLVHAELFETKEEALARERLIKSWKSAKRIKQLISGM